MVGQERTKQSPAGLGPPAEAKFIGGKTHIKIRKNMWWWTIKEGQKMIPEC